MEPVTDMLSAGVERASTALRVNEIYESVQGESTWAGLRCIFVRLARCHLRCVWCDTAYAFHGGDALSIKEIVEKCREMDCSLVEITGGEPLVQPGCADLAQALLDEGHTVLVETSGTLPIAGLPPASIKIMDLKCPGSGESDKNHWANIEALSGRDEVKFVIADRADYEWAKGVVADYRLDKRCNAVLFSPVHGSVDPKDLAQWIIEDGLNVRLQLQLHKYVWPPDERGV